MKTAKLPVLVAVTGYGREEDRRSGEAGIHLHLVKPVDPESLQQLMERLKGILGKESPFSLG